LISHSGQGFFEWFAAGDMRITRAMIEAAQRAEFDINQRMRRLGAERFVPTPPEVVRAMLQAALATVEMEIRAKEVRPSSPQRPQVTIVTARKPRPRP
jgi:hypothetical protein